MPDLTVSASFTENGGEPATGLTLADINLYLTSQDRDSNITAVVWDGTQHPTGEVENVGAYIRIYAAADLDTYNYFAAAEYVGAVSLDLDWVTGAVGLVNVPLGTAVEWPYLVRVDGSPVDGARVQISTDLAGDDVFWSGVTGVDGYAVDAYLNAPRLVPRTEAYYFWVYKANAEFSLPDQEVVI